MRALDMPDNEIRALEDGTPAAGRIVPETELDMVVLHAHVKGLLAQMGKLPMLGNGMEWADMTAAFTLHSTDAWDDTGCLTGTLDVDDGRTVLDLIDEHESMPTCRYWLIYRESSRSLELWWEIEPCAYTAAHSRAQAYRGTGMPVLHIPRA